MLQIVFHRMPGAEMTENEDITIARLGAQGDGVVVGAGEPRYVPFTLPGERVRATFSGDRGHLVAVLVPSADRVPPACRHFGTCGGCSLQHMADEAYAAWKREQVIAAFCARGIAADVKPLIRPEGKRRRAVLSARRTADGMLLGFHEAQSHDLVDIAECPVLEPRIVSALSSLKKLLQPLVSRRGEARLTVTMSAAGLDVSIEGIERALSPELRSGLASQATAIELARVSIETEPIYEALPPYLVFGAAEVVLPPGAFIQAVAKAEHAMADLIVAGLGKAKTVVDLFAGFGAFTFPIAKRAKVLAIDSDKAAIEALARGAKRATGIKPVTTLVRDLFREPLSALELNEHDAVVFDPPRAGAEAQARMIAKSKLKAVVAVSCNPATLARDARILIDGGYKIDAITPIDQFLYSPHIEVVAVFRR
jgi:23S rRNA (uracil1939-C5)-methyltransferase